MPRTVADQPIHTRTGRARLSVRGKPYFRRVTDAIAIGYRKPKTGPGRWVIRERKADGEYAERAIPGVADDLLPGNGEDVLGYDQAVAIATQGVKKVAQDISVPKAVEEWADSKVNATDNPKRISDIRSEARRISAPFAKVTVKTLRANDIEKWRDSFLDGHEGKEARRRRRATANRSLANLKAALTGACKRHGILLDYRPWDAVSKFGKVEAFGKRVITLSHK